MVSRDINTVHRWLGKDCVLGMGKEHGGIAAAYRCGSESNAGDVPVGLRYQSGHCDPWSGTAVFQSMLVCVAVLSSISG